MTKDKKVSVRLPKAVADMLRSYAVRKGMSLTQVFRTALWDYIDKHNIEEFSDVE